MAVRMTVREVAALTGQGAVRTPQKRRQANPGPVTSCGVREIVLELPLPPTGCSPNRESHAHWQERSAARDQYRAEIAAVVPRLCGVPMFRSAVILCEFFHGTAPGRYRAKDEQNAIGGLKSAVDQLVTMGYLPDDTAACLTWGAVVLHSAKESAGRACVLVTLRRREAEKA